MLYDRIREDWKPDYVIPFSVTKEQCKEAYLKKVKQYPFVSSDYRKPELIESFKGIYMPYWYFECKQKGQYIVTKQKSEKKDNTVTTTVYDQYYRYDLTLNGYSHDASVNFDDHLSERLAPYDVNACREFHPAYLSGFYAEIGDVEEEEYRDLVVAKMQDYTSEKIAKAHSGQANLKVPTDVKTLKCALHPVWFMSYRKKNRITYATVNGLTGKVAADFPLSPLRILSAALAASAFLFGLIYLLMNLLPSVKAPTTLLMCSILTVAGMYYLADSYCGTVSQSLRIPNLKETSKYTYIISGIASGLSVLGTMLIANDGTYYKDRAVVGYILLIPSAIYSGIRIFKQFSLLLDIRAGLRKTSGSRLENGIIDTARKYHYFFVVLMVISLIMLAVSVIFAFDGRLSKSASYSLCGVLGAIMVLTALLHVLFQTKIAKRRPPQMDKKGAYYDET